MSIERFELVTDVADIGNQSINDVYGADKAMRFWGDSADFRFRLRTSRAGVVNADRLAHSMAAGAVTDPFDSFLTARVLRGTLRFAHSGEEKVLRPGDFARYPTADDLDCSWEDVDLEIVRIPLESIDAAAAQVSDEAHVVQFFSMQAVSSTAATQWSRLSHYLHELIDSGDESVANTPLVQHHLGELVAATALTVFPNSVMTSTYTAGVGYLGPASLRRAIDFMESHLAEPLTLADIAAAVGVGPRALQIGFRRHHGTTPLRYLRQLRLQAAHRELQAADPGTGITVKAIAARWGFGNVDRFSAQYREAFGSPPSDTLRR